MKRVIFFRKIKLILLAVLVTLSFIVGSARPEETQ